MVDEQRRAEMEERAALLRKLIDRFGGEVLDVVSAHTAERVRARLEAEEVERRDLSAVMELLWDRISDVISFDVLERTPAALRIRVTRCPFAEEMRRLGATEIGDALYCAYDEGFCEGLNPAIRFERSKTLMAGDDCCNHTYRLEG